MSSAPTVTPQPERCPPPWWRRADTIALAVLLGLTLVGLWHRWVFDNWLARHDLLTFFLPWLGALGDRLRAHDVPALNPYIFSGAPFAGDPESGWMFLPAMLVFPFFEVTVAYKLMIALLMLIAGSSTYALGRLIGYSVPAALFAAVAFEFGPYFFGQTNCCTVGTNLSTFFPLAFLGVELAIRAGSWPVRIVGWCAGGLAVSQMFAAWLGQGVVNALLLLAAWVVFRTLITPPDPSWSIKRRLAKMVATGPAVLVLGVLLGAAGILPRLAANAASNNPGGSYEHTPGASVGRFYTLAKALSRLLADGADYRDMSVWGTTFLLMVLAVLLARRHSVIPFFAVAAIAIPAITMNAPIVADLVNLLPRYEEIQSHSPGRILWLYPFVAAMLAGAAVHELPRLQTMRARWLVAIAPLGVVTLAAWYVRHRESVEVGAWTWAGAITATALLLSIAASARLGPPSRQRVVRGATALLIALVFLLPNGVDIAKTLTQPDPTPGTLVMWGNDAPMQDIIHESLRRDDPGGVGDFLQDRQAHESPFRFIAYGGMYHPDTVRESYPQRRLEPAMIAILENGRAMRLELETTQGYDPVQPLVYQELIAAMNGRQQDYHYANLLYTGVDSPLLDLLNVRYIVVDRAIPESRDDHRALAASRVEVYRDEYAIVYESRTAQPRAWMVYDVRLDHDGAGLSQLAGGRVDGGEVAFVDRTLPAVSPPPAGEQPEVTVAAWSPDGMTLRVSHKGEGLLIVSEVYSDAWRATIDGEPVDVLRADHALLGIPIGPGEHTVELRYAPGSLTIGLWISGVTGLGWIAGLVWSLMAWIRARRGRRHGSDLANETAGGEAPIQPASTADPADAFPLP
jgi:hypothetical protein